MEVVWYCFEEYVRALCVIVVRVTDYMWYVFWSRWWGEYGHISPITPHMCNPFPDADANIVTVLVLKTIQLIYVC